MVQRQKKLLHFLIVLFIQLQVGCYILVSLDGTRRWPLTQTTSALQRASAMPFSSNEARHRWPGRAGEPESVFSPRLRPASAMGRPTRPQVPQSTPQPPTNSHTRPRPQSARERRVPLHQKPPPPPRGHHFGGLVRPSTARAAVPVPPSPARGRWINNVHAAAALAHTWEFEETRWAVERAERLHAFRQQRAAAQKAALHRGEYLPVKLAREAQDMYNNICDSNRAYGEEIRFWPRGRGATAVAKQSWAQGQAAWPATQEDLAVVADLGPGYGAQSAVLSGMGWNLNDHRRTAGAKESLKRGLQARREVATGTGLRFRGPGCEMVLSFDFEDERIKAPGPRKLYSATAKLLADNGHGPASQEPEAVGHAESMEAAVVQGDNMRPWSAPLSPSPEPLAPMAR